MKSSPLPLLATTLLALLGGGSASAAVITETYNFTGLSATLGDGNPAGYASYQPLTSAIQQIQSVQVRLSISGTFNGDLYAYVSSENAVGVLLNRPGKTASNPFGYADDGIDVTFDDSAANNIHTYQLTLTLAAGTPVTGTWQPDGRNTSPDTVTDASPTNATLANFIGTTAAGGWTLFVADLAGGEVHTVNSWGLTITGNTVPEPAGAMLAGLALTAGVLRRRRVGG